MAAAAFASLAAVAAAALATQVFCATAFPELPRLVPGFSTAYLRLELTRIARDRGAVVLLGDGVLWGDGLAPEQSAAALLRAGGLDARNLAFVGATPASIAALARALVDADAHPARVLVGVDVPRLAAGPGEPAPAVAALDGARVPPFLPAALAPEVAVLLGGRAASNDAQAAGLPPPAFAWNGAVAAPLSPARGALPAYVAAVAALARAGIPSAAILLPVDIDRLDGSATAHVAADAAVASRALSAAGASVLDETAYFRGREFSANGERLAASGQRHLAAQLEDDLAR